MSNKYAVPIAACIALVLVALGRRPHFSRATPPPAAAPVYSAWETGKSCPLAVPKCAALNNTLYVIGGYYTTVPSYQGTVLCHAYNPATHTWSPIASLPTAITHAGVATGEMNIPGWRISADEKRLAKFRLHERQRVQRQDQYLVGLSCASRGPRRGAMVLDGTVLHFMAGVNISRVDQITHWTMDLSETPMEWKTSVSLPSGRNHVAAIFWTTRFI